MWLVTGLLSMGCLLRGPYKGDIMSMALSRVLDDVRSHSTCLFEPGQLR